MINAVTNSTVPHLQRWFIVRSQFLGRCPRLV